ncbi:hypothetical protein, partial [Leptospira weilii]|uniref:hypothetical protein n=1 Tax=Leptospira weilii TaxID=28184 RepID=UPI000AFB7397
NDPNIKFLPIDTWTNIKIFTEMDHINYIQKNVSAEIQKEDSSIRDFFHLERNIFAFQEVLGITDPYRIEYRSFERKSHV